MALDVAVSALVGTRRSRRPRQSSLNPKRDIVVRHSNNDQLTLEFWITWWLSVEITTVWAVDCWFSSRSSARCPQPRPSAPLPQPRPPASFRRPAPVRPLPPLQSSVPPLPPPPAAPPLPTPAIPLLPTVFSFAPTPLVCLLIAQGDEALYPRRAHCRRNRVFFFSG